MSKKTVRKPDLSKLLKEEDISVLFQPGYSIGGYILEGKIDPNILESINSGELRLVNSISTVFVTRHKGIVIAALYDSDVKTPRTLVGEGHDLPLKKFKKRSDIDYLLEDVKDVPYSPLLVYKKMDEHKGKWIEFVTHSNLRDLKEDELMQAFIYPPFDDGYMRDVRCILLGDSVEAMYFRRAPEPLINKTTKQLIESPPSRQRTLTNIHQGGVREDVPYNLKDICEEIAIKAQKAIVRHSAIYAERLKQSGLLPDVERFINFNWGAVDFIFNQKMEPMVLEVDSGPDVTKYLSMNHDLGVSLASYLGDMSESGYVGLYSFCPFSKDVSRYLKEAGVRFKTVSIPFGGKISVREDTFSV